MILPSILLLLPATPIAPAWASAQGTDPSPAKDAGYWKRQAVEAEFMGRYDEAMMARLRALQHTDLEQDRRELARLAEERRGLCVTVRVPMPPELDPDKRGRGFYEGELISCAAGRIATATDGIIVWDEATGARIGEPIPFRGDPVWIELSPDGERLAVYDGEATTLSIVHLDTSIVQPVDAPVDAGGAFTWSPDGKWLAACVARRSKDSEGVDAHLCDGLSGARLRILHVEGADPYGAAFSRDGDYLAFFGAGIVRVADGAVLDTKWPGPMAPSIRWSRVWSWRSGENVLDFAADGGILCSYDAEKERWLPTFHAVSQYPGALHHDAARKRWIVAVHGLPAMIVPERMGDQPPQFQTDALSGGEFDGRNAIAPNGRFVAVAGTWDTVRVWDTVTGERLGPVFRHGQYVSHVNFTASGRLLTASNGGWIRLWDFDPLRPGSPSTLRGQDAYTWEDATDQTDARGLAVDPTHVVEILRPGGPPRVISERLSSDGWLQLETSPNGRLIAASGENEGALVWDLAVGGPPRQVMPPDGHAWFTFDASGQWLLAESHGQVEALELFGERRIQRPAIQHTWGYEDLQQSYPVLGPLTPKASWLLGPRQLADLEPTEVLENALVEHQWGEEWVGLLPGEEAKHWFGPGGHSLELDELTQGLTHFEPEHWLVAPGLLAGVAKDSVALFRTPSGESVGRYLIDRRQPDNLAVRLGTHRLLVLTPEGIEIIDASTGQVTAAYPVPEGLYDLALLGDSDQVAIRRESYRIVALDLKTGTVGKPLVTTGLHPSVEQPLEGTWRLVSAGSALWSIDTATGAVADLREHSGESLAVVDVRVPEDLIVLMLDGLWLELRRLGTGELVRRVFIGLEGVAPSLHIETTKGVHLDSSGAYLLVGGPCHVRAKENEGSGTWQPGTFRVLDAITGEQLFSFNGGNATWGYSGPQIIAFEGKRRFIVEAPTGSTLMSFELPGSSGRLSLDWRRREVTDRYGKTRKWSLASGTPVPIPTTDSVDTPVEASPAAVSLPDPPASWTAPQRAWWKDLGPSHDWLSGHVDPGPNGIVLTGTSLLRITPDGPVPMAGRRYPTAALAHNDGLYTYARTRLLDERHAVIGYRIDGNVLERTLLDFGPSKAPPMEGEVQELIQEWSRRLGLPGS